MLNPIDQYFNGKIEPTRGCLLSVRSFMLGLSPHITETLKYGMPFYCYKGKMMAYLWTHKKYKLPYIGIVEGHRIQHPLLLQEKRARMKILLIDPQQDLDVELLDTLFNEILKLYA